MKYIYIIFLLSFSFFITISAQSISNKEFKNNFKINNIIWETSFKEALKKSKKEKKPILIYFTGSDWCVPCKKLKTNLFETKKFIKLLKGKIIFYKADFPRNKDLVKQENKLINKELSERYKQTSFPTMIIINNKGEVLGRKNGIYMIEYYYSFFKKALLK